MKCRIVGDNLEPLATPEPAVTQTSRASLQPLSGGPPAAGGLAAKPTKSLTAAGPDGPITVHPADIYRRMVGLEAVARMAFNVEATVWGIVHGSREHGQVLGAMVDGSRKDGPHHIFVNLLRSPCGVIRLALLAHEIEHIRGGDLEQRTGYDPVREAECETAAGEMCKLAATLLKVKGAAVPLDAAACQACYTETDQPCRQGGEVWAEVTRLLDY